MDLQFLQAKATITPTTDLGEFRALVATYDRDRTGDEIKSGAFARSISEWREVGRRVPLHWNHEADQIIGDVDPAEMWETDDGLEVAGHIDLDDEQGRKVWKQLKANRLGFSFGYVTTRSEKRGDGGLNLLELDIYEVSATPSPANNRTRILSTKSATAMESLSDEELRERSRRAVAAAIAGTVSRTPMSEEDEARVERSKAEYQAARKAEVEAEEEEQARRRAARPATEGGRRSLNGMTYEALDPDAELATPQQIEEREQRRRKDEAEIREIEEARAKAAEEEPPTISVCGMEVARVTVNGVPVFGEEL